MRINEQYCRRETLANLEDILTNDEEQKLGPIVTRMVAEAVVPWHKREDVMTDAELIESIKEYVRDVMKRYHGSINGYASYKEEKWLVLSVLFGLGTADSLVDYDTNGDVVVRYKRGTWSLEIPGMKRSVNGQYYNDEMLEWCKKMAPRGVRDMPEEQMTEVMLPVYRAFKPQLYNTSGKLEIIHKMALESPFLAKMREM